MSDERDDTSSPAPSLWPIGFAIGVACVLVGLVVSVPALIVGAIIALVFGFLWMRDLLVARPVTRAPDAALATGRRRRGDRGRPRHETSTAATFLSLATIGVGGADRRRRDASFARLRRAAVVHGRGGEDASTSTSGRSRTSRRNVRDHDLSPRPGAGEVSRRTAYHPQQRAGRTTAAELHDRSSAAASTSAAPCSRTGRSTSRPRRRSTASSSGRSSGRASAALPRRPVRLRGQPHRRPARPLARPLRVLDQGRQPHPRPALQRRQRRGHRRQGADHEVLQGLPGRARGRHREWLYPIPTPGSTG